MTTLAERKRRCAVCGHEQEYTEITSTNSFGPMDLDSRPPEMQRSTMDYWIQLCEKCGYSCGHIEDSIPGIGLDDLKSEEYQALLNNNTINKLSRAFLLAGHLYSKAKEFRVAGFRYLRAAWAFDDRNESDNAKHARNKAIENMNIFLEGTADTTLSTVSVDLYRRNGRFEEAEERARRLIDSGANDVPVKVLEFQILLCKNKDKGCYTVGDVKYT